VDVRRLRHTRRSVRNQDFDLGLRADRRQDDGTGLTGTVLRMQREDFIRGRRACGKGTEGKHPACQDA
jgi:hypothetical protein